jgi:serine/threonine protein phosphatase 1
MTYAIADIHGCYDQYREMLNKISFTETDTLYIIGDVIDRGPAPLKILDDMRTRKNIIPILGNHEYQALRIFQTFKRFAAHTAEEFIAKTGNLNPFNLRAWMQSYRALTTLDAYEDLSYQEQDKIVEYLIHFSLYEEVTVNGQLYLLTHIGLPKGSLDSLKEYSADDFLFDRMEIGQMSDRYDNAGYGKIYGDYIVITGHFPTFLLDEAYRGRIYRKDNHINIDTGAVYGESLACLCLDSGDEFYA